jgi:hypothetical protein
VSFELRIFFPHPTFPAEEWYDILGSFRSDDCYVRFDEPTDRAQGGVKECYLIPDESLVNVYVSSTNPDRSYLCEPLGTHWNATVSTGMGRSRLASWIQFAIPYHALVFFPGVTVHDCEFHLGRSTAESSWTDPESWLHFADRRLRANVELIERGLFTADGTPRF